MGEDAAHVLTMAQLLDSPKNNSLLKLIHVDNNTANPGAISSALVAYIARNITNLRPPAAIIQDTISIANIAEAQLITVVWEKTPRHYIITAPRAITAHIVTLRGFQFTDRKTNATYRLDGAPFVAKALASSIDIIYKFTVYIPSAAPEYIHSTQSTEAVRTIVGNALQNVGLRVTHCNRGITKDAFKMPLNKFYVHCTLIDDRRGADIDNIYKYLQPKCSDPNAGVLRISPDDQAIKDLRLCPEMACYRPLHYDRDGKSYCPANCLAMRRPKRAHGPETSLGNTLTDLLE